VILEFPIDLRHIYESDDPSFLLWLSMVMEKVSATHKAERAKIKKH